MTEQQIRDAKIITLAMAKLREYCGAQDDCLSCPLSYGENESQCALNDTTPNKWDVDQALYRIGFKDGGANNE